MTTRAAKSIVLSSHSQEKPREGCSPLDSLQSLLALQIGGVNEKILEHLESQVPLIPALASYLIQAGGKRLRPLLALASAELCGYEGQRHINLAAAIEFIHSATLLHDDVVDESTLRRGQEAANLIWGNQASVLVGDFLFSRAFELMTEDGSVDVLRILSKASATIAEGEVLQLTFAHNLATQQEDYLRIISAKTAELFAAACEVGAVIADESTQVRADLRQFGLRLGIAFQLVDDVLDYSAHQATLGKTIGDDFREGKITLPVILAYEAGASQEKAFWQQAMSKQSSNPDSFKQAQQLLSKHQALHRSIEMAKEYTEKAKSALHSFPDSGLKTILTEVCDFCVERKF